MERIVLHVDANSFYASVELLEHPELKDKPVAVCGDAASRHGIILAKNEPAKACGVKTAEAIWMAKQKCPDLILLSAHFSRYHEFSQRLRTLYNTYSDRVEPFGLDECWIELTHDRLCFEDGIRIGDEIRRRVREEIGLTVSVGVSYNKVFAKLGSDMKKPDGLTALPPTSIRSRVWPLPVSQLLFVGPHTAHKLREVNIYTIGDLALTEEDVLFQLLGKSGPMLQAYARGMDSTPVMREDMSGPLKSVGNSTTPAKDMETEDDVRCVLVALCEQVAGRLRAQGMKAGSLSLNVRTPQLNTSAAQLQLPCPTTLTDDLFEQAMHLFSQRFAHLLPLRSIGISCGALIARDAPVQMDLLGESDRQLKREAFEDVADNLRRKFGPKALTRARTLCDDDLTITDIKEATLAQRSFFTGH